MKHKVLYSLFLVAIISLCSININAQNNLSRNGAAHLRAAEMLKDMMSTSDDKLQVAEEYEKVIENDPDYAPAYLEAARIYSALTPELGKPVYQKAKSLFNSYAELNPSDSEIDAELIVLEALLKKHANGPSKTDGVWVQWSNGKSFDVLDVRNNGTSVKLIDPDYLFTSPGYGSIQDVDITLNGTQCSIIVKVFHDERSRLREKGWSNYVGDCDGDADPGFPRYGQYKYNESLTTWYYTVNLAETPLVMECEKIHTDYYLNGDNTYSDTDRDRMIMFKRELSKK